jgi:site-specific DNA-methyltransferase (cytosine-N4-specific)
MEKGVEKGLVELLEHLSRSARRMPWLGLFKEHIGDYVDWAFSDFRTWGLHFIHKHEGKADPWLARSCVNLLGLEEGSTILDPFCGSGTFIADAPLLGVNAIGVDISPLSTMISRVKCSLMDIPLADVKEAILKLQGKTFNDSTGRRELDQILARLDDKEKTKVVDRKADALQILSAKAEIDDLSASSVVKDFLYTVLSRSIVEAFERPIKNARVVNSFLRDAAKFYLYAYVSREIMRKLNFQANTRCDIFTANAWSVKGLLGGEVDGIVSSPPYFDALDYYGFSVLPIAFLGLNGGDEQFQSRIIGSSKRSASDADLFLYDLLPESSQLLIRELLRVKREKKARVVLHYLNDMSDCLHSFSELLSEGNKVIFVVGRYHNWRFGSKDVRLDGAQVLIDIAEQVGFTLEDELHHDISKIEAGNRIREESIIIWRKGGESRGRRDPERSKHILLFH